MASATSIEWTDTTWNPTTGCDRVSPGCDNCYALTMAKRLKAMGQAKYQTDGTPPTSGPGFGIAVHPDTLYEPFTWVKPRKVFVNSMSDLFHKGVPSDFIAQVFAVMALTPRHTYQVLTKRHARLRSLLNAPEFHRSVLAWTARLQNDTHPMPSWNPGEKTLKNWPVPNVWLGVSVEDQHWADIRVRALAETPAAVRFLSAEPLLGEIVLNRGHIVCPTHDFPGGFCSGYCPDQIRPDWIITGGESGPGARPAHPAWFRNLRDQSVALGIAYLHKQNGAWTPAPSNYGPDVPERARPNTRLVFARKDDIDGQIMLHVGKHRAGRELDGVVHDGYPQPKEA
jgi:protein gp37